ncbi:MAG TPA: hypothetical protein VM008_06570 [Phycisphaerae bacterium]|nr:hypothetical protein [Phycisphaerae bacterium]
MKSYNPIAMGLGLLLTSALQAAGATTLRVASYNVNLDTGFGGSGQLPALEAVLEGIGQMPLNDNGTSHSQPIDILALQELARPSGNNPSPSLQTLVNQLNASYGAGTYAFITTPDPTDAGTTGNGPNGLIYNTKTVQFVSAITLGIASGSGAPRAPIQYTLQPVGYSSSAAFYVDVSHAKSGTDSTSASRRNIEATTIVNSLHSLPANSHVIALGDFNITSGSSEPTYQTLRTGFDDPAVPSGVWDDSSSTTRKQISNLLSESATGVRYRDDIQFVTSAANSSSAFPGLQYDAGSFNVFGNGGSTSLPGNSVNSSSNIGALPSFSTTQRSALLFDLTEASDHLPIVADYDVVGISPIGAPEPATGLLLLATIPIACYKRRTRLP